MVALQADLAIILESLSSCWYSILFPRRLDEEVPVNKSCEDGTDYGANPVHPVINPVP